MARAEAENAAKPNIVVVLTDDEDAFDGRLMDYMPNAKAIFKHAGITFTDFHASSPLCCPSRANFFTGQFTHNHLVVRNSPGPFKPQMTLATQLDGVGYYTALVGKYLNAYSGASGVPLGWDRFSVWERASTGYYDYELWNDGIREYHGSEPADYATDVFRQKAVEIISGAPSAQPLFLWIGTIAPHSPTTVAPRHQSAPCSPPVWQPPGVSSGKDLTTICRNLLAVDDLVAAVRDALAASGRLENTILIWASDNGMNLGRHGFASKKSTPYATHVPFYLAWPAGLGTAPRTISERLQNIDLAPTLCTLAGCTLGPYPNGQATPDGLSFAPLLVGAAAHVERDAALDEMLIAQDPSPSPWAAVTTTALSPLGRWHYIEWDGGGRELYDISNSPCEAWQPGQPGDPCELTNRASDPAYASLVRTLHNRLAELKAQKGRPLSANTSPTCRSTTLRTPENTPAEVSPVCTDADGDPLAYSIVDRPTKGTASVVDGKLRYEPALGATGSDSFTYKATDDGNANSNAATVSVTIGNSAPVCENMTLTTSAGAAVETAPRCSDPDPSEVLTYAIVDQPSQGAASVVGGKLRYQPASGATGSDSFTYQATDTSGAASNTATVAVTIQPATRPLTFRPTGDGSRSSTIKKQSGGTSNLFAAIDEPVAAADDGTTYIRNSDRTSGSYHALLTDTPADFASMAMLSLDVRVRTRGVSDDQTTLFAQVVAADEGTALTDEVAIGVNPGNSTWTTLAGVPLTLVGTGTQAHWDGARLRLRWDYRQVGSGDSTHLRVTAVELDGTYWAS